MAVNGKAKGNAMERDISKILNDLYRMDDAFSRSLSSGAKFGGSNSAKLNIHKRSASMNELGDIATPDGVELIVECKSYNSLPFHQILQGNCKVLNDWLQQVNNDRETFYKVFKEYLPVLLVFKINRAGTYFVMPKGQIIKAFCNSNIRNSVPRREYIYGGVTYLILQLEEMYLPPIREAFISSTM